MNKKIILTLVFGILGALNAFAKPYGMGGCGLGSLFIKDDDMIPQILASTTNGTSASQTFGITSGTSNCTEGGVVAKNMEVPMFIEANQVALASDIARGNGETLASLSHVMGCSDSEMLGSALKSNYKSIFSSENIKNNMVTTSIVNTVKGETKLAQSCNFVI